MVEPLTQIQTGIEPLALSQSVEPLSQLQTGIESISQLEQLNQLPASMLNDISLMCLLQQQQRQQQQQQHQHQVLASIDSSSGSTSTGAVAPLVAAGTTRTTGAGMMMMSPATLHSLLVSQVMVAIQPSPAVESQSLIRQTAALSAIPMSRPAAAITSVAAALTNVQVNCLPPSDFVTLQSLNSTATVSVATTTNGSIIYKPEHLPPPKKPLTPYMKFSKSIWQHVKNANPSMSVCEVGASIGRLWREMSEADKQRYNDDFSREKTQYEADLQQYLKTSGMQMTDITKVKSISSRRNRPSRAQTQSEPTSPQNVTSNATSVPNSNVLPHIGQIWALNPLTEHLTEFTDTTDLQSLQRVTALARSTQGDIIDNNLSQSELTDDATADILPDGLLSTAQLAWLEQSDDSSTKRFLNASDGLLAGIELQQPDGLEPGEVVFDELTGVTQTGSTLSNSQQQHTHQSAHNVFNSYAFNPWKRFQGVLGPSISCSSIFERDHLLQAELRHLRQALDDKMREIRELTNNIQKAYSTIDELHRLHNDLLVNGLNASVDVNSTAANAMTERVSDVDALLQQELMLDCGETEVADHCLDSCLESNDETASNDDSSNTATMLDVLHDPLAELEQPEPECGSILQQAESLQ